LTKEQRHLFCKIIIALAEENKDTVVALMKEAGFRSKRMDPNVIYLYAKVCYDEDNKELTNGKHIQLFMEDIQNTDPIVHLPSTLHFLHMRLFVHGIELMSFSILLFIRFLS
jgi:hypothetical protein